MIFLPNFKLKPINSDVESSELLIENSGPDVVYLKFRFKIKSKSSCLIIEYPISIEPVKAVSLIDAIDEIELVLEIPAPMSKSIGPKFV